MKEVTSYAIKEFTYRGPMERYDHTLEMKKDGWTLIDQGKTLKNDVHIFKATEDDFEWYARFQKLDI